MKAEAELENWDDFLDNASVGLHCVDKKGIILWANSTELKFLGYAKEEYIGRFIGDFHLDDAVINDLMKRLQRDETLNAFPARLRARDGSVKHMLINSNVYRTNGEFRHTRCFTTGIQELVWRALRTQSEIEQGEHRILSASSSRDHHLVAPS